MLLEPVYFRDWLISTRVLFKEDDGANSVIVLELSDLSSFQDLKSAMNNLRNAI